MFGPPAVSSIGCNGHDETELQPGAGARISRRAADVTMDSEPAVGVDSDTPDESRRIPLQVAGPPAGPRRAGARRVGRIANRAKRESSSREARPRDSARFDQPSAPAPAAEVPEALPGF